MALTYSLRYRKINAFNKVILEKEGEIVIDRLSFRLKGKGARDMGENVFFGDMKELHVKGDSISFSTYSREKYILSDFANLFDSFIKDFFRVRNQFLEDSLFMKSGMLVHEYDCQAEIVNVYGKTIPRGKCKIRFYEGSIVIVPDLKDCFSVNLNFLKNHEFDEDEYVLKLVLDNGQTIRVSKLGTSFEDARDTFEALLGKLYERAVLTFSEALPGFGAKVLLKLIQSGKEGRFVPISAIKKIDSELLSKIEEMMYSGEAQMVESVKYLRKLAGEDNFFVSLSFTRRQDTGDLHSSVRIIIALPEHNVVVTGRVSEGALNCFYCYKIIMQQGNASDKLQAKILELEQALLTFKFDMDPLYKDRKDIRKTKYSTVIKKLSFMRLLRKSFLGRVQFTDINEFENKLNEIFSLSIRKSM